jgi:organic hydroperoxide reductase OsmC/OhrA
MLLGLTRQSGCFAIRQLSISVSCSNVEFDCFSQRRAAAPSNALRPKIKFGGASSPSSEDVAKLHQLAHEHCFLANSVLTSIVVEPL